MFENIIIDCCVGSSERTWHVFRDVNSFARRGEFHKWPLAGPEMINFDLIANLLTYRRDGLYQAKKRQCTILYGPWF